MQNSSVSRRLKHLSVTLSRWSDRLRKHQTARLVTGLAIFAALVPGSLTSTPRWEWIYPLPFVVVFCVLVIRTRRIGAYVQKLERWQQFLLRQQRRQLGQPSGRGYVQAEEISRELPLIRDLGLVGSHSLWTLIDETLSAGGRRRLLHWMCSPVLSGAELRERQRRLQQLQSQTWFYTRLAISTSEVDVNVSAVQIQEFLTTPIIEPGFRKVLLGNVLLWLATFFGLIIAEAMEVHIPAWAVLVFPVVSISSLRAGGAAFRTGVGLAHHLGSLTPIFSAIEKRARVHNKTLAEVCPEIVRCSPSRLARRLDFVMNFVGTQTNPILHFLLNAFLPWTVVAVYFLERVRVRIAADFPVCLAELEEFEVLGSMLVLAHYQGVVFPELVDGAGRPVLECRQIFHPLLDRTKAVANDFAFAPGQSLGLLTGSNMSGKSTFLRTLGINQVLANMGAPVFAKAMRTTPLRIETCIEVTDSLRDGYSYFYAEVRKLRHILSVAASSSPVLYLIDEIFRGTNNRERQLGSRAVIQALARTQNAVGFISTHDLELTALATTNASVVNLHFREDLDADGKMHFHYHLNHGPSPTTNALTIMRAEGITIED